MKCKYCGKNFNAKNSIFCSKNCDTYYSTELKNKDSLNSIRVTMKMDQDVSDVLREIQSNLIRNSIENVTFSQVANLVLKEGIKSKNILKLTL